MAESILDTATFVDLQRAPKHRRSEWALNTMRHASDVFAEGKKPGLSPLVNMEIEAGFEHELRSAKHELFQTQVLPMFQIIPFGIDEATLAGEIYARLEERRMRIGVVDTCLAATALVHGLVVVSSNLKHFARVHELGYDLKIENWRLAPASPQDI